ncbi:MAG: histidine kinase [Polaromonas sp.]|nr:histidine kinase [Polaromonas sp.]
MQRFFGALLLIGATPLAAPLAAQQLPAAPASATSAASTASPITAATAAASPPAIQPPVTSLPADAPVFQANPNGVGLNRMLAWADPGKDAEPAGPPAATSAWTPLALPDRWRQSRPGYGGSVWYAARVDFAQAPAVPWAVYLPRVIMNAEVWVNGVLVGRDGSMRIPYTRNWNTPLLFTTPNTAWRQGANTVHIRAVAHPDDAGGMAVPQLGRADIMAARHSSQTFWQNKLVYAANISVISLGFFLLAVWARKRERADYGYFAAGALLWGVSNFNMTARDVPLSYFQWELLIYIGVIWALLFLGLFGLRFGRVPRPWLERSVMAYGLACALFLSLAGETGAVRWSAYWLLPVLLLGAVSMYQIVRFVRSVQLADYTLFALVTLGTLSLGAHDWMLQIGMLPFESGYGLPFMAPLLLAALGWLIAGDYARTQQDLALLNNELADRVRQKEQALRETFDRVASLERAQAVSHERTRILRDMHDGVGMHLTSAIRQLQSGVAAPGTVEQTLRDSLDQLKLSIDVLTLPEGDVGALLGSLRFRMTPRLEAIGLQLHWHMDLLPLWPAGHHEALRHLQYIVFEAVSNVLQHSGATELTISGREESGAIVIRIEDNGRGCAGLAEGNGLRGMQVRARAIGAQLEVGTGEPTGCEVVVKLPLQPLSLPG